MTHVVSSGFCILKVLSVEYKKRHHSTNLRLPLQLLKKKIAVQTTMTVTGGVTVCLLVMVTLSLSLDANTSPVSSQESETQHSRRLHRLEAEMEVLRKFITDLKQDCRSGLHSSQTSVTWQVAQEVAELRAQLQAVELRRELWALQQQFTALQPNAQVDLQKRSSPGAGEQVKETESKVTCGSQREDIRSSPESKAAFLGQLPSTSNGRTDVPRSVPINFSEVFDIGDGHDPLTGVYTVVFSGVYLISLQMFPDFIAALFVDLKMNGNVLVRARATQTSPYTASCSSGVTVRASPGDRIWLETSSEGLYWGGAHSFLSIALITSEA